MAFVTDPGCSRHYRRLQAHLSSARIRLSVGSGERIKTLIVPDFLLVHDPVAPVILTTIYLAIPPNAEAFYHHYGGLQYPLTLRFHGLVTVHGRIKGRRGKEETRAIMPEVLNRSPTKPRL